MGQSFLIAGAVGIPAPKRPATDSPDRRTLKTTDGQAGLDGACRELTRSLMDGPDSRR